MPRQRGYPRAEIAVQKILTPKQKDTAPLVDEEAHFLTRTCLGENKTLGHGSRGD
jgi:hypothetical protein